MSTINVEKKSFVLIHGWGCDQSCWQPLIADLENFFRVTSIDLPGFGVAPITSDYSLDNILSILIDQIPPESWVMGWSLGGMLAIQLAHRYPQIISGVISLAANAKLVADDDYPDAMPLQINQNFNQSFKDDPAATLKLFSGLLAQGAEDERGLLKQFRKMLHPERINPNWHDALLLLSKIDNRQAISEMKQPCLQLLASDDSLVPASIATYLKQLNSQHQIEIVERSSHALHWCHPEWVSSLILSFVSKTTEAMTAFPDRHEFKSQVAKKFSKAASTYDQAAEIQRVSGNRLLNEFLGDRQLPENSVVMDLGCGTGFFSKSLQKRFNYSSIVGVDLSFDMLSAARTKSSCLFVAGDAEKLPFSDNSIDLIYSNFALQWCFDLPKLFSELKRVLKPNGEMVFTTLGNKSLHELRAAWNSVDNQQHVNRFVDQASLINFLNSGFSLLKTESQLLQAQFDSLHDVLHSIKAVGATYHTASAKGLMGRKKWIQLTEAYEQFRTQGKLPLSYDVIFVWAKKHE